MKLKKAINYFILGAVTILISTPCFADIKGTVILPGGISPDYVTVRVFEHSSQTSSGFKDIYTFNGDKFVIPTKKDKAYRFEMRGENNGVEYYGVVSQIPYKADQLFKLEKVYPIEVKVQDKAGNLLEAYTKTIWDNGYRSFSNWANDKSHTIYTTKFKVSVHNFSIQADGYKNKSVSVQTSDYRTNMNIVLEPLQIGYTLNGKVRYEDGTPVKNNHFFEQGPKLTANAYQGSLYFKPEYGEPKLATVLPRWDNNGSFTIPNLLPGNYYTDVIFQKENQVYRILNEVNINSDKTQDLIARPTNVLKVFGKDAEGNLLNEVQVLLEQEIIFEDGSKSNKGVYGKIDGSRNAIFPDLKEGLCKITIEYPGYKKFEKSIEIVKGMNTLEITLKK